MERAEPEARQKIEKFSRHEVCAQCPAVLRWLALCPSDSWAETADSIACDKAPRGMPDPSTQGWPLPMIGASRRSG